MFCNPAISTLPFLLLLCFQRVQLSLLAIDLSLLRLDLLLDSRILFLPSLHLIADQCATQKPYRCADPCACPGVPGGATDNGAQARSANGSDGSAFFSRRQLFRAANKQYTEQ